MAVFNQFYGISASRNFLLEEGAHAALSVFEQLILQNV